MSELIQKSINMINDFVAEKGINVKDVYFPDKLLWRLKRGTASIDIMLLSVPVSENQIREFLQVASPIIKVPKGRELEFYKTLLELNDVKLGVKLSLQKDTDQVWALYERDLIGMSYTELITCLEDLGYWADEFDDILQKQFGE
ncbi:MAG TPA: YbjN domain-containing protein [Spirochaetota bacterium]|nr:YbjN domain-containing protein [Spirochaetota bacterium]